MNILLDHCVDWRAKRLMPPGHVVRHTSDLGWQAMTNGSLLAAAAAAGFDVFVTTDKNVRSQQYLAGLPLPIVERHSHLTRLKDLAALQPFLPHTIEHTRTHLFVAVRPDGTFELRARAIRRGREWNVSTGRPRLVIGVAPVAGEPAERSDAAMTGTTLHLVAFAALAVAVAWGSATAVNAGLVALVAALAVGSVAAGLPVKAVVGLFPADLFLVLVGATLLFAIVRLTGTIDVLAHWAGRAAAGRRWLVPVLMFLLSATMATAGAFTPAAVAIVAPVAMELATRHRIHRLAMGLAVVEGANAGAFSPANPFGAIAREILREAGEENGTAAVYLNAFAFNAALAVVGFVAVQWWFGPPAARAADNTAALAAEPPPPADARLTPFRAVTLVGLAAVLVSTLGFRVDVGVAGLAVALVLVSLRPALQKPALEHVPWPAILLVTGIVTYVGVLGRIGSIAFLEQRMARLGGGAAAALVTAYLVAVVSAFASTVGTLGAAGPIVTSLAASAALSPVGVVSAIGVSAAAVDLSPMSTSGALLMATAERGQERAFFRALLVWAGLLILLVPPLAWLVFVVL